MKLIVAIHQGHFISAKSPVLKKYYIGGAVKQFIKKILASRFSAKTAL
jgi:hypothetical protein